MNLKLNKLLAEISAGELVDKITILEIKKKKIKDQEKLAEVDGDVDGDFTNNTLDIDEDYDGVYDWADVDDDNDGLWDFFEIDSDDDLDNDANQNNGLTSSGLPLFFGGENCADNDDDGNDADIDGNGFYQPVWDQFWLFLTFLEILWGRSYLIQKKLISIEYLLI